MTDRDLDVSGLLRRLRRLEDLSQRQMAEICGVSQAVIARAESGRRALPHAVLVSALRIRGWRLAVLDHVGAEVTPMPGNTVRDRAGRRFPVHLDPRHADQGWWRDDRPQRYGREAPWFTYDHRRSRPGYRRRTLGFTADHPVPAPDDDPEVGRRARIAALTSRQREAWSAAPPLPPLDPDDYCRCGPACERHCVRACDCQCEPGWHDDGMDEQVTDRWQARFRAARVSLPDWADDAPQRCLYVSNATGVFEIYAWDRRTASHRQVTDRPNGTSHATLDAVGEWIWWFADTDGDEWGVWVRQPFDGGPDTPAVEALDPSYPSGLALGRRRAVVGRSTDDGASIHVHDGGGSLSVLYASEHDAHVGAMSRDESMIAIGHAEHGDSRHMALRVYAADGRTVADKWDGASKGLDAIGFSPVSGDHRLLVRHERRGRPELLLWDLGDDSETELAIDLPGELEGSWYDDGRALLIGHDHEARSELYRYELSTGELSRLDTPAGVVGAATARPDGAVGFTGSSSAQPSVVRAVGGGTVLTPPGPQAPVGYPVEDVWVDGPGGRIHALLCRPASGAPPYPAVFAIHGGPEAADDDSFRPRRAAFVDAGYAVVHVNYRGSSGYGSVWRDALEGRPGLTELEDIAAVRAAVVDSGKVDPARCALEGGSWGGYLTLLGLGTQPELWAVGLAAVPVADYVAAYDDEMEGLRAFDRAIFGGSPTDVPEVYERCSPISYVDRVRAPVLVLAGANDPRCPIRQIENYLAELVRLDLPHEVYRFDAGHGSLVVEEQIRQMAAELDFLHRHLPTGG
ncbi:hypothetical protein BH20ACT5_BH20ACT5_12300 [soil metagenome]